MIEINKTRSELRREFLIKEMSKTWIHLPNSTRSLWDLASTVGVEARVEYVNNIGRATHSCYAGGWAIEEKRHDLGLILKDGTEIKGVEPTHFNFFKEIIKIKKIERQ